MPFCVMMRHGESLYNLENRFSGNTDVPLSLAGIEQAKKAGKVLKTKNMQFDIAFTSKLQRAYKSLYFVLDELESGSLYCHSDSRLNERSFGAFEGIEKTEISRLYGEEIVKDRIWNDFYYKPPDSLSNSEQNTVLKQNQEHQAQPAESLDEVSVRVIECWNDLVVPFLKESKNALIVTHGGVLKIIIKHLEKVEREAAVSLKVLRNTIPIVYEFSEDLSVGHRYYLDPNNPDGTELELVTIVL